MDSYYGSKLKQIVRTWEHCDFPTPRKYKVVPSQGFRYGVNILILPAIILAGLSLKK